MRVLIADDDLVTRTVVASFVSKLGHDIVIAEDGAQAWEILNGETPPDIALLDWEMPHLDGVDICERLKTRAEGEPLIYTILLTGKSNKEDRIIGYNSGAHDFYSKPVDPKELRSRVAVGERLVEYDRRIAQLASNMERLAESRAKQLIHADRLVTLGTLSAGIVHEINNPVSFISGNIQMFEMFWPIMQPVLQKELNENPESKKLKMIIEEFADMVKSMKKGTLRIKNIIQGLKAHAHGEKDDVRKPCDLKECVENALLLCQNTLKNRVRIEKEYEKNLPTILGNHTQIEQVIVNLFTNAADAMGEKGGVITVNMSAMKEEVVITVKDNGSGIPEDVRENIWDPFYTSKPVGKGTGLGLSISKGLIKDHKGTLVLADADPSRGAMFVITLPIEEGE